MEVDPLDALAAKHGSQPTDIALSITAGPSKTPPSPDVELDLLAKQYAGLSTQGDLSGVGTRLPAMPADVQAQWERRLSDQPDQLLENVKNIGGVATDLAVGAGKSLVRSGERGGALLRKIPGVDRLSNALPSIEVPDQSSNTTQKIGGVIEQVAEVVNPAKAVSALGAKASAALAPSLLKVFSPTLAKLIPTVLVEATGNAALAKAQGATNTEAATTGALTAGLLTTGQLAARLSTKLRESASEGVYRFFNPSTKRLKAVVAKRTPEILERGSEVLGTAGRTRAGASEVFGAAKTEAGEAVDEALQQFGSDTVKDAPQRLQAALDLAKRKYVKTRVVSAAEAAGPMERYVVGKQLPSGGFLAEIPLDKAKVKQIEALKEIVAAHGNNMSVDDLVGLRRAWDEVAYANAIPGEIGPSTAAKWAKKMGGDSIRGILSSEKPDLAELNREFAFWSHLSEAMDATALRKVGQVGGIIAPMAEGAGQVAGAAATGLSGAGLRGGQGRQAPAAGAVLAALPVAVGEPEVEAGGRRHQAADGARALLPLADGLRAGDWDAARRRRGGEVGHAAPSGVCAGRGRGRGGVLG